MPLLEVRNLSASYGAHKVLTDISLSIEKGEVVSLIGPSGSGKSTLLRALIGLVPLSTGSVSIDGQAMNYGSRASLKAIRDRMAIVFQQYNLFQNMDVLRNVTIAPLEIKKRPKAEVDREARAILDRIGLSAKLKSYPDQLSGGQQQRVAIARALALKPEILLFDEVTAALDPELVNEVLDTISQLANEGITMLIVSHEMGFVRKVSSRVAMMDHGQIIEVGTPEQLFQSPKEARTREFVGKILRH